MWGVLAMSDILRTNPKPLCILCGSPGTVLYQELRDRLFSAPGLWRLKQCCRPECGLVWSDPAPLEEDLGLAYRTYYTHTKPAGNLSKFKHFVLAHGYRLGISVPAILAGLHRERRDFRHMFLGHLRPGRIFDVGCGDGQVLARMSKLGWRGAGIDFDAAAVETGRQKFGQHLQVGDFQTAQLNERDFDAVTMSHVIEHVPDPIACLKKCRDLLKPGGQLVVTTPNIRSLGHATFKENWRGLEVPRHLHIFAPNLLGDCARAAGLAVLRTGSTAVNADYMANASIAIQKAPRDANRIGGGWNVRYALASIRFQYREHFALRRNPDVGEEAFLIAERRDTE